MGFRFPTELFAFMMYLDIIKKGNREELISHKHLSELPHIYFLLLTSSDISGWYPTLWNISNIYTACIYLPCKSLMTLSSYFWGFCQLLISPVMLKLIQMTYMLVNKESLTIFITFSYCLLYYTSGTGSLRCVMQAFAGVVKQTFLGLFLELIMGIWITKD